MPVLNISQNQVLPTPVSDLYRNRLIQAQTANVEKSTEQADEKLDLAKRQAVVSERRVAVDEGNLDQRIEEYGTIVGREKAIEEANTIIGITEGAKASDNPLGYANERMPEFIATLPEDSDGRKKLEQMATNGFSAEEMQELYTFAMAVNEKFLVSGGTAGYAAKDTYLGPDGKKYHMWYDKDGGAHRTGILAEDDSGNATDFEPPNNSEREAATALIEKDSDLDELSRNDKDIAAEILANDIRQIQATMNKPYQEAAAMAVASLKTKLKEKKGFWGKDKELVLGASGTGELGENEYLGDDGHIYVDDGNGNFARAN